MAEKKSYIYEIIIDTRSGIASLNGTDVALGKLGAKIRQVQADTVSFNKNLKDTSDVSGLASAATVELGRTFGDAGYGIQGVTNNVQQLGTLFTTLIGRTGKTGISGVRAALDLMGKSLWGPLGIIVAFQALTAAIEYFSRTTREAKEEFIDFEKVLSDKLVKLDWLGRYAVNSKDALSALKGEFKELADFLNNVPEGEFGAVVIEEAVQRMKDLLQVRTDILVVNKKIEDNEQETWTQRQVYKEDQIILRDLLIEEARLRESLLSIKREDVTVTGEIIDKQEEEIGTKWKFVDLSPYYSSLMESIDSTLSAEQQLDIARAKFHLSNQIRLAEEKEDAEKAKDHRLLMLDAIGDGLQSIGYLLGKETQEGKAIAAAGAIIETYSAIVSQLRNASKIGLPGPVAIAQAVATGLFGLAQVKKIYSVKVPNSGGSAGAGAGAVPSDVPIQQPDFNIVGVTRGNQIRDTIQGALGKPIRAYVTTKDIRSSGELDRNIVRGATVG